MYQDIFCDMKSILLVFFKKSEQKIFKQLRMVRIKLDTKCVSTRVSYSGAWRSVDIYVTKHTSQTFQKNTSYVINYLKKQSVRTRKPRLLQQLTNHKKYPMWILTVPTIVVERKSKDILTSFVFIALIEVFWAS